MGRAVFDMSAFFNAHAPYVTLKEKLLSGKKTDPKQKGINHLTDYFDAAQHILRLSRLFLAEPETGGMEREYITKELYDVGSVKLGYEPGLTEPSLWCSFIAWFRMYMMHIIANENSGSIFNSVSYGLGWSRKQVSTYMNMMDFTSSYGNLYDQSKRVTYTQNDPGAGDTTWSSASWYMDLQLRADRLGVSKENLSLIHI